MTSSPTLVSIGLLIVVLAGASPAGAQSGLRPYAGGSVGSFSVSADEVEGTSASVGFLAGIALAKYVDFEFEVVVPTSTFTRTYTGASVSFAPPEASTAERERLSVITRFDKEREVSASISAVVVIHPPAGHTRHAGPHRRCHQPTCARPDCLYADLDPRGRRSAASGGRRAHRVVCTQHRRPDHRGATRHRGYTPPVRRSGCALRLRLDRR